MTGRVDRIWTAPEGSATMESVDRVHALPGGIEGDRYFEGTGYYSPMDVCEVTFIAREDVDAIREATGIDLSDGRHRRNVVLAGADLDALVNARFRVGDAVFEGTRRRPPCRHVEQLAGETGVMSALKGRGGICADVIEEGDVSVGDEVELLEDLSFDGRGLVDAIRSRLE
ncbi:MOSC domain-containing protein [Halorarius halobius]|uniref:MOSC domain-containing protein n=1 Tax=Halorarius halobius TaxID=2962671 RepID=UPI0020CC13A3|nr:MOSC domain-containing protein [Halorarius halobius]